MKNGLDRKTLILATLACLLYTAVEVFLHKTSPVHWHSPKDFKLVIFWLVLLLGWAVFFLQKVKKK